MPTNHAEFYRGAEAASGALAGRPTDPVAAATAVHTAAPALFGSTPMAMRGDVACKAGCAHCCHFPVGITFPEAMRLAAAVRPDRDLGKTLRAAADATATTPWSALVGLACPLLLANQCRVHGDRPLPCRALASSDANSCAAARDGATLVPRDEEAYWRGLGASHALAGELGHRELRAALAAVLATAEGDHAAARQAFVAARQVP